MPLTEDEFKKLQDDLAASKAENEKIKAELEKSKTPFKDGEKDKEDSSLNDKVQKEREAKEKALNESKRFENVLRFTLSVGDFVQSNSDILPSDFPELLKAADKEKYDTEMEKAAAIKSAMIQSFFSIQSNMDILTNNQKNALDDYFKLTKNGKAEKSEYIYENIFEPALEMTKRIKKVEELNKAKSGAVGGSKIDNDYKARLMAASRKTYMGEK